MLPGPTGCVTAPDDSAPARRPDDGCALGRGLRQVHHVALSPDERFLYTAAGTVKLPPADDGAIGVYRRDARTGGIVQVRGARGCVKRVASPYGGEGCATARNLQGTRFVAVGPEGRTLYSSGVSGISVFRRDPASGALRQLRGPAGCFNADGAHRCARLPAAAWVEDIVITDGGRLAYAVSSFTSAVMTFRRDPATGRLRPASCVAASRVRGCRRVRGIRTARSITLSADGRFGYAAGENTSAVIVLRRHG